MTSTEEKLRKAVDVAERQAYVLTAAIILAVTLLLLGFAMLARAYGHEHTPGESAERARVTNFLQQWRRPKGVFAIVHRYPGCCYSAGENQDCFVVKEMRVVDGVTEVLPDPEGHKGYDKWFKVDTGVDEDLQTDPRESPDGRSYVCIQGNQVVCFVRGAGA